MIGNSRKDPTLSNVPDEFEDEEEELDYTCPDCGSYVPEHVEVCDECLDDFPFD